MDKEQYEILFRMEGRHWWYLGMQRITGALLAGHLEGMAAPRILDAGCGTGGMLGYLGRFGSAVGADVAEEAVAFCRQRGLTSVVRSSVEGLPFGDGSFDLVVSFDVLYHQAVGSDRLALAEFHRVLRPGGLAVIRVPAYDWLRGSHDVAVHTKHRYTARELAGKLHEAGFQVRKLTHVNCLLFPVAAAKRLLEGTGRPLQADLDLPSPLANRLLLGILSLEAALVRSVSLPWGLSVMAVATKPSAISSQPGLTADS